MGVRRVGLTNCRSLVRISGAGIDGVILDSYADVWTLLRAAAAADGHTRAAQRVSGALADKLPAPAHAILEYVMRDPAHRVGVDEVARSVGISRTALHNRLRRAKLPSAGALIGWTRLLLAAAALEDHRRSVEETALAIGYYSGTALANMLRRYTGLRICDVRKNGLSLVLDAFLKHLRPC